MRDGAAICEGKINVTTYKRIYGSARLVDLYKQLVKSYDEGDQLKEAPMNIEKLKLSNWECYFFVPIEVQQ